MINLILHNFNTFDFNFLNFINQKKIYYSFSSNIFKKKKKMLKYWSIIILTNILYII